MLGVIELAVVGAGGFALVAVAVILARRGATAVTGTRVLHPPRVHAGTPARVDITATNSAATRTPLLVLTDAFDRGRRTAEFLVAPLDPKGIARAAYRVPTNRRGVYVVGPLTVARTDPFGLARTSRPLAPPVELTVYPRVDQITPLRRAVGHDPMAGTSHATRSPSGEDFFTLREYVQGDDLRRVHWKSTARSDELMIRQNEMPWQTRATVLLDTRSRAHMGESFERCVEITASVVAALASRQTLLRFITSAGFELGFGEGHQRYERIMEHLATVTLSTTDHFAGLLGRLRREGTGGSVVAVAAAAPRDELLLLSRLGARFTGVVLVHARPGSYGAPESDFARAGDAGVPGVLTVPVTSPTGFPAAWNGAMARWRRNALVRS
jgi:uncharacterized protein (DUF58 family)